MYLVLGTILCTMVGCPGENKHKSELGDEARQDTARQQYPPAEPIAPIDRPERFSDSVRFTFDAEIDFRAISGQGIALPEAPYPINVRAERPAFAMQRVPGDPEQRIEPFYLSTTEVTAEMFYPWATGAGLKQADWVRWASLDLRPSQMHMDTLGYGPPDRPAMGMSRTVAEHYCRWLSEQTGRRYRLPTDAEWRHALRLGGGVPRTRDDLLKQATLRENMRMMVDPPFIELPTPAGQRPANALGLHDMLGNAAEWVTDTGKHHTVRGGHFLLAADALTADWLAVEDSEIWNASSPWAARPDKPTLWYRDFYFTGIRLALDADQAPATQDQTP